MLSQKQVVIALLKPETYCKDPGSIELLQTHISFVFLTSHYVYKVKKAVNFGFLDFTTLDKRRLYCEKELKLNQRLCGEMYLEVVPINKNDTIKIKGAGRTIEYAVKMKRMPQETMMSNLIKEKKTNSGIINRIAKVLVSFHEKAKRNRGIASFGSLSIINKNWQENFEQTEGYIDRTVSANEFKIIRKNVEAFIRNNAVLFKQRITKNRIRDCHGDIHSGNIFVTDHIYIFDAIEFNDRFRYCDVASDIAFLAMDLDFKKRPDLSDLFVEKYVSYSGDRELLSLIPFYKCYRAYIRGKVLSFKLKDPNVLSKERCEAKKEAKAYFKLAAIYANKLMPTAD